MLAGCVGALVILTNVIYHYVKWYRLRWKNQVIQDTPEDQRGKYSHFVGDDLAKLKVRTTYHMHVRIFLVSWIPFISRMIQLKHCVPN